MDEMLDKIFEFMFEIFRKIFKEVLFELLLGWGIGVLFALLIIFKTDAVWYLKVVFSILFIGLDIWAFIDRKNRR